MSAPNIIVETNKGSFTIETRPDLAPKHVERITQLVSEEFYDGVVFHRVIEGFMAQTGDPTGTGSGGSGVKLDAEFSDEPFDRAVVGMARTQHPDSGDSQWFVMFDEGHFLNGQYTVWGKVTDGMDVIDSLKKGAGQSGKVSDPDYMVKARLAE